MLCGATPRGEVRAQRGTVLRRSIVISAGVSGLAENWEEFIFVEEQIVMHEEQTETEGEGAPVHISAASARRRCPSLAVKLSSCCEAARRRDYEWADPRQLRRLKWRSAKALGIIYPFPIYFQAHVALGA